MHVWHSGPVPTTPTPPALGYTERLTAPWWLWLLVAIGAGSLGIAYAAAFSAAVGVAVTVPALAVGGWLLVRSAARVCVRDGVFVAGRASIPVTFLAPAQPLTAERAARLRGPEADPRAWMLLRGWIPTAVQVGVTDPDDDTPYWFVSTRRPDALADAINAARATP